jgi:hypothetical protein
MKRKIQLVLSLCLLAGGASFAQNCPTSSTVGSSSNSYTNSFGATNSVAVDKDLNSVVFIHRNNTAVYGGDSGELRYDISTDGGNSWTSDLGVLNASNGATTPARFPQACIYNPTGNTNPINAYLSYFAVNLGSNGSWDGAVNGVRKLNGTGNTENYNQAGAINAIPTSMVKGAPGVFWSIVPSYNGNIFMGAKVSSIKILKGTWNNSTQDVQWSTNNVITPNLDTSYSSGLSDYHISFSPSGQIGWIALSASMTGITAPDQQFPVFYRTLNGGATWTGPFITNITDQNQFPCISSWSGSSIYSGDLTVDINGAPHFLTSIGGTLLDITVTPNTVSNAKAITFQIFGISPTQNGNILVTRTADGSKIFYCWGNADASLYYTNPEITNFSNLYSKALDVSTMFWTPAKNFTSCNTETNGKIFFPKTASEVLQPSPGVYKLAIIYADLNNDFDLTQPVDFKFLNGIEWHNSDFTVPHFTANPVITATASSTNLCEGTPLTLTATGNTPIIEWSSNFSANIVNGVSFIPNTILPTFTATGDTFGVLAMNAIGCKAYQEIYVSFNPSPSVSLTNSNPAICAGLSQTLTATSSGNTITWMPGNISGGSITVTPNTSTSYTATATSPNGCTSAATTLVTVNPIPSVTAVASSNAICAGASLTLTGEGTAEVYTWNNGVTNGLAFQPNATNTYTLTGTNTTTNCSNTANVSVAVNPLPTVTANSSETVFCIDGSGPALVALPIGGTWSGAGINNNAFSPLAAGAGQHSIAYAYTDINGCTNTSSVTMTVHALPNVTINTSAENICSGSSVTLSGEGATSYVWTNGVVNGETFEPTATSNYSVTGTDSNECVNSANVLITVNTTPSVTNQSPNQTAFEGTSISFFVETAQGVDTYQWQTNIGFGWQDLNDFGQYSGSSSNTLTIASVTNSNNNQPFRCIVTLGDCSDTSAIALLATTEVSIDDINGSNSDLTFGIYPNPFSTEATVIFDQTQDQTRVEIYDAQGKRVKSILFSGKHLKIESENLAPGIYVIHAFDKYEHRGSKRVIQI